MEDTAFDEIIYRREIEYIFSLIDFDQNNEISETEFLSATARYKKVANFLKINLMEEDRLLTVRELIKTRQNLRLSSENDDMSKSYVSLMDEKSISSSESNENLHWSICQRFTPLNWLCKRPKLDDELKDMECKEVSKYGATEHLGDKGSNRNTEQIIAGNIQTLECKENLDKIDFNQIDDGFEEVFRSCNKNIR